MDDVDLLNQIPLEYRWTPERAMKDLLEGYFYRVGPIKRRIRSRLLAVAPKLWASSDPDETDVIYHTGYRITGTVEDVITTLRYAGITEETIDDIIAQSITKDNTFDPITGEIINPYYLEEMKLRKKINTIRPQGSNYQKAIQLDLDWVIQEYINGTYIDDIIGNNYDAFLYAIENQAPKTVILFLNQLDIDPRTNNNEAYNIALNTQNNQIINIIKERIDELNDIEIEVLEHGLKPFIGTKSTLPLDIHKHIRKLY